MSELAFYTRVCGIDLAKESLELRIRTPDADLAVSLGYDDADCDRVVELCRQHLVQIVVVEATGGLQRRLALALVKAAIPVAIINPGRIRHYALAEGMMAKTDKVDARIIALFALKIAPKPTSVRNAQQEQLARLAARKAQLIWAKVDETNRLQQEGDADALGSIQRHLKFLKKELDRVDRRLDALICADVTLQSKVEAADTVLGVGRASAVALIVNMPELGTLTGKQAASLAGVAPFAKESGKSVGERHIQGGRAPVRSVLYMCTLTAVRCEGKLRDFYEKRIKAGHCKMEALTACMRKMLVIINARVRDTLLALKAGKAADPGAAVTAG
jgi:transposase